MPKDNHVHHCGHDEGPVAVQHPLTAAAGRSAQVTTAAAQAGLKSILQPKSWQRSNLRMVAGKN